MATIKNIKVSRNWGKRPDNENIYIGDVWFIEKGEEYDLLQFTINELDMGFYWNDSLCVPCGKTEEELLEIAKDYAKNQITDESIKSYRRFLEFGQKYGWD